LFGVYGHCRRPARVMNDLKIALNTIGQCHPIDGYIDDASFEYGVGLVVQLAMYSL